MTEALGNRVKSGPFGLIPERIVRVSSVDNPAEQHQCGIAVELVLLHDRLERALLAVMTQFDVRHVVWNSVEPFRLGHNLVARYENELGILVDKFLDQPRASYPINLHALSRDPLHDYPPRISPTAGLTFQL